jgi:23S rRNA pseudouridine2605 synthase
LRQVGLARALSKLGYCSRSEAVDFILAGRVRLNGVVRRDAEAPVRLESARIEVDGRAVARAGKIYLMLNKPRGVVTTASDEKGRQTVYEFLDSTLPWVGPVGRLDKASEGLLLLTNDSDWAAQVTAPETHLDKTYHVQIDRVADAKLLQSIEKGIKTADGDVLRVKSARILRGGERNTWLEIILDEGKNRHIRRMLASLNVAVLRLVRIAIGPLPLGQFGKGKVRSLTLAEKSALDEAMQAKRVGPQRTKK